MITRLEPLSTTTFKIVEPSILDLFDTRGILFPKGKPITPKIHELLLGCPLYTLRCPVEGLQEDHHEV